VDLQRLVCFIVELDLSHLHVNRKIDQHRPGPAGTHHVESFLKNHRHEARLFNGDRPLRDRLCNRLYVDSLEVFFVELLARRLAGDAKDGE